MCSDAEEFKEGISEKFANAIQHSATFLAGLTVGLIRGPLLTLVIIAFLPFIIASAGSIKVRLQCSQHWYYLALTCSFRWRPQIITKKMIMTAFTAYGKAGGAAMETLGGMRTVAANGGEKHEVGHLVLR